MIEKSWNFYTVCMLDTWKFEHFLKRHIFVILKGISSLSHVVLVMGNYVMVEQMHNRSR